VSETDTLLECIQSGIAYTRAQHALGEAVQQATRFSLPTTNTTRALSLMRRNGMLIASAPDFEEYELGIPRPDWVKQGMMSGLHDPQWWDGNTAAEVKAGPHADESMVKKAAAHLKGPKTKTYKKKGQTAREKEIDWKLREGLRRQEAEEKMYDKDSEDDENGSDSERDEDERESEEDEVEEEDKAQESEDEDEEEVRTAPKVGKRVKFVIPNDSEDEGKSSQS
jgi:hypothetical protein